MEQDEVNLDNLGREPIFKGDLYRTVAGRLLLLKSQAQLFDHYFVLAKTVVQRDDVRNEAIRDVSILVGFLLS
jgi:tRNA isopentenyl-2-thiomethyl-A-37 hydroxylase MiaE